MTDEDAPATRDAAQARVIEYERIAESCIAADSLSDAAEVLLEAASALHCNCADDRMEQKRALAFAVKSFECEQTLQSVYALVTVGELLFRIFDEGDEVITACEKVREQCDSGGSIEWVEAQAMILVLQGDIAQSYNKEAALQQNLRSLFIYWPLGHMGVRFQQ